MPTSAHQLPRADASAIDPSSSDVEDPSARTDGHRHWESDFGTIGVIWRSDDPIMLRLSEFTRTLSADVLVKVDPNFGLDGPTAKAVNRTKSDRRYDLPWRDLARVLGQPMPYWPHALRDPDLISGWAPGSPPVEAPARPELDINPLLRMASMFEPGHPTHRTLLNLAMVAQQRPAWDAANDLHILGEALGRYPDVPAPTTTVAAVPLVINDAEVDTSDVDETSRRIGLLELLHRCDTLSRACVQQIVDWDGGRTFPFCGIEDVQTGTAHGMEWAARLEPLERPTAAFIIFGEETRGEPLVDPVTGAPAIRRADGTIRTVTTQRLPTTSALSEVVIDDPIWVRAADGSLYLAPRAPSTGLSWGYGGSGPVTLAQLIDRLLDDITTNPSSLRGEPQHGLRDVTVIKWPRGHFSLEICSRQPGTESRGLTPTDRSETVRKSQPTRSRLRRTPGERLRQIPFERLSPSMTAC
jgi:hypothetical protein